MEKIHGVVIHGALRRLYNKHEDITEAVTRVNADKMACACKGVTYRMIIEAVRRGAGTFEEVQAVTRCSSGCRRCEEFIRHFVSELIAEKDRV